MFFSQYLWFSQKVSVFFKYLYAPTHPLPIPNRKLACQTPHYQYVNYLLFELWFTFLVLRLTFVIFGLLYVVYIVISHLNFMSNTLPKVLTLLLLFVLFYAQNWLVLCNIYTILSISLLLIFSVFIRLSAFLVKLFYY